MGEIIKKLLVSVTEDGPRHELTLFFDSGATRTFVKRSAVERLGTPILNLPEPRSFRGMGDGSFDSSQISALGVHILDVWCMQPVFVIEDRLLGPKEDMLVGHDFLQTYDIKLDPKGRDIIVDRDALLRERLIR